jgi:hypothetical protein
MAGMDMFKQTPWMGGFVQYADPIPPGPHVYGPPPYGIWPTSVRRPVPANGAPVAPSSEAEARKADVEREWDREKALFIEKKRIGQPMPIQPPPPAALTENAAKEAANSLLPKKVDTTMLFGGVAVALVGVGTRIFAEEKTTTQTLASAAAILGGVGLVYKALQLT